MPTYEYRCKSCDKTFEKFQNVNDSPLKKCIYCGGEVARIFHPVGVIFKGSGFYSTDYKKKGHKETKKPSKPKESDFAATPDKKKEKVSSCAKKESCPAANSCS